MVEEINERGKPVLLTSENLWFNKALLAEALGKFQGMGPIKATGIEDHEDHNQQTFWIPGQKDSDVKLKSKFLDLGCGGSSGGSSGGSGGSSGGY
jgi:hypothetical protein